MQAQDIIEALTANLGVEAVPAKKAGYVRIVSNGTTLVYADFRAEGVRLETATARVEKAPAKVRKTLNVVGAGSRLTVGTSNVAQGRALIEWLAKAAS